MNPSQAFANRTARLVREATTPVYSTETVVRERAHLMVVEMEADSGYRSWSGSMHEDKVNAYIDDFPGGYMLSDIDHAANCWCQR